MNSRYRNSGYKLLLMILILTAIFVLSIAYVHAATIAGGKYFSSENFTSSIGGQFKVYGVDPYKVYNNYTGSYELYYRHAVVMSNIDDTVSILNGSCERTTKYSYCFKGSSINFKDEKTFQDGYMQSVMNIVIETLPPSSMVISFARNTSISAYCGEIITVPITVTNNGTVTTNISYTETMPLNTVIIDSTGGILNDNIITFRDRVFANTTKTYSYKMINLDCQSKKWVAQYNFTTLNDSYISKNITNLNITTKNAYFVNETLSVNKTNNPWNQTTYTLQISNNHSSIDLQLNLSITIPNAVMTVKSLGIVTDGGVYRYVGVLPVGKTLVLNMTFYEKDFGTYTIKTDGTININDHVMDYNSSKILYVLQPNVVVYLDINNTVNKSMSVNVWARNDDVSSKYYYLYGILKGIFDEEPVNYNVIEPDSTVLVSKIVYNTTNLGVKNATLIFDGVYRDRDNIDHKLYLEQNVTLNVPNAVKSVAISTTNTTNIVSTSGANSTSTTTASKNNKTASITKTTSKTTNSNTSTDVKKKDVITRAIEALSEFLQAIFGK